MATLAQLITSARTRAPCAVVTIGGRTVLLPDRPGAIVLTQTFGQPISGGTIQVRHSPRTIAIGDPVSLRWGYNGQMVQAFTGFVTDVQRSSYPNEWSIQVKDPLWKADFPIQQEEVNLLNNKTAREVVTTLLATYGGLSRLSIPAMLASGTAWAGDEWLLGTLTPIAFRGMSPLQAALQVCSVLGFWLFCDAGGVVQARQIGGAPHGSPFRTFVKGSDFLLSGPPVLQQQSDQIYNKVVVYGANTGVEGAQIKDSWQTSDTRLPAGVYREFSFSSPFIEYVNESEAGAASCTGVARRLLKEHDREPNVIRGTIKADPRLAVGMTVALVDAAIGVGRATSFFLSSLQTTFGGGQFNQTLTLDGGVGPDGYSTIPPPLAVITYTIQVETLESGKVVEVFLDGSGSKSLSGGEIVSYHWTDDHGNSADGITAVFVYAPDVTTTTITLTVTDTTAKEGTASVTIDLVHGDAIGAPTTLGLSFCAGSAWYVTPDAGATWRVETSAGDAIATPPIGNAASENGLLATAQSGATHVRGTTDYLETPAHDLATLGAQVRFLWQNELDATRVWAAVGDRVYASLDTGATWAGKGRPAAGQDIAWIVESAATPGALDVLAGANAYVSTDGGLTFRTALAGPEGATAKSFVSGFDRHWVGFLDAPEGVSPLQAYEGGAVAFPAVDPPVGAIPALTMLVNEPTLIAIDDQGRIWRADATDGSGATPIASTGALPGAYAHQCIRNPDGTVVFIAANEALKKLLVANSTVYDMKLVGAGEQGHAVGYSQLRPAAKVEFVLVPYAEAGANDQWAHYRDGSWSYGALPQAGWKWASLKINPRNPDQWLLLGFPPSADLAGGDIGGFSFVGGALADADGAAPLYYSADAGASWSAVALPPGSPTYWPMTIVGARLASIGWSERGDAWYVVGVQTDNHGFDGYAARWVGATTTGTASAYLGWQQLHWSAPGLAGDILSVEEDAIGLGTSGGLLSTNVDNVGTYVPYFHDLSYPGGFTQPFGPIDVRPAPSRAFYIADRSPQGPGMNTWEDYRDAIPGIAQDTGAGSPKRFTDSVAGDYVWVGCAADRLFIASAVTDKTGFYVCSYTAVAADLAGDPAHPTFAPRYVRVGRMQRIVMVGYGQLTTDDYQFSAFDGRVWADIPMPARGMHRLGGPYDTPYDVIERSAT